MKGVVIIETEDGCQHVLGRFDHVGYHIETGHYLYRARDGSILQIESNNQLRLELKAWSKSLSFDDFVQETVVDVDVESALPSNAGVPDGDS